MRIFPAIDLYEGKAVRLYKGNYDDMTVYSHNPIEIARDFVKAGASHIHMVDLEGAKDGTTPNINIVEAVARELPLFVEVGGGIRSMEVLERYIKAGVGRAILGTAAVTDEAFLREAVLRFGDKVAVGVDIKDGAVAIKGWTESSGLSADEFFSKLESIGVSTVICTDVSRDGAMRGTNLELYRDLQAKYTVNIIASGGVSSMSDILSLREMKVYGAIIGKAYYTGAINLKEAISEGEK